MLQTRSPPRVKIKIFRFKKKENQFTGSMYTCCNTHADEVLTTIAHGSVQLRLAHDGGRTPHKRQTTAQKSVHFSTHKIKINFRRMHARKDDELITCTVRTNCLRYPHNGRHRPKRFERKSDDTKRQRTNGSGVQIFQ